MEDDMSDFYKTLNNIQTELKTPKDKTSNQIKYSYRSAEDILAKVKPLLNGCIITCTDEAVMVGGVLMLKATAKITDGENSETSNSYVPYDLDPKFMSKAQGGGATSSYARKYALQGLFALDDGEDDDELAAKGTPRTDTAKLDVAKKATTKPLAVAKPNGNNASPKQVEALKRCKPDELEVHGIHADSDIEKLSKDDADLIISKIFTTRGIKKIYAIGKQIYKTNPAFDAYKKGLLTKYNVNSLEAISLNDYATEIKALEKLQEGGKDTTTNF